MTTAAPAASALRELRDEVARMIGIGVDLDEPSDSIAVACIRVIANHLADSIERNMPHCCPSCCMDDEERARLEAVIEDRRGSVRALRALASAAEAERSADGSAHEGA